MKLELNKQNLDRNIQKLAAQRYLYSSVKMWVTLQYFAVFGISIFSVMGALKITPKLAYLSLLYSILDIFLIERFIKNRQKEAALIQEDFDCDVLDMEWSKTKCGAKVPSNEILIFAGKMKGNVWSQKLQNWYPAQAGAVESHLGRLICQRVNIAWNLSGRKRVSLIIDIVAFFSVSILVCSMAIYPGLSTDWLVSILIPCSPIIGRMGSVWFRIKDSTIRNQHLQSRIQDIWKEAVVGKTDDVKTAERSREFQNELFDFRSREIPVFEGLYWKLRDVHEQSMNQEAELLVNDCLKT